MASLGTDLIINDAKLLGLGPAFLLSHLPLAFQVDLIADQQREPLASLILVVELQPPLGIIER